MPFLRSYILCKSTLHYLEMFFQLKKATPRPLARVSVKNEYHRSAKGLCVVLGLMSQPVKSDMLNNNYTVFKVIADASAVAQFQALTVN